MEKIVAEMKPQGLAMDVDRQQFALALKTWRLRANLTQKEVGERWGTSRYTIMKAERAAGISWEQAYKLFAHLSEELRKEVSQS